VGVAAAAAGCGGKPCADLGIYTVRPDGSDQRHVAFDLPAGQYVGEVTRLAGDRIAYTDMDGYWSEVNSDGSIPGPVPGLGPVLSAAGTTLSWIIGVTKERNAMNNKEIRERAAIGFAIRRPGTRPLKVYYRDFRGSSGTTEKYGDAFIPDADSSPRISPDGRSVAFADAFHIWTVSTRDRVRRRIASGSSEPVWSPDSNRIAFVRGNGVHVVNADGSRERLVAARALTPAWLPDGRDLVVSGYPEHARKGLYVVRLDGHIVHRIHEGDVWAVSWAPSDRIAFIQDTGDPTQDKCGD